MNSILITILFIFIRSLGAVVILPFEDKIFIKRVSCAIFITFISYSELSAEVSILGVEQIFVEFMIGFFISLPLVLILEIVIILAEFIDNSCGHQLNNLYDPLTYRPLSVFSRYMRGLFITLILLNNGFVDFIDYFIRSFNLYPIAENSLNVFYSIFLGCYAKFIVFLNISLINYLPVGMAFFIIDLICGYISKHVAILSFYNEINTIKTCISYLLILYVLDNFNLIALTHIDMFYFIQ